MAVIFPKGIYTEGQGIFDPTPYIKYMDAKKKARAEAVTKANDDLYKQMNTAGARSQDLEVPADVIINGQVIAKKGDGIAKDMKDWIAEGIANRDAISKGGMAKTQYEDKARNILTTIQKSKNRKDSEGKIVDYFFQNKIEHTPADLEKRNRIALSLYDPRSYKENFTDPNYIDKRGTEFELNDFDYAINPLNQKEKSDLYNSLLMGAQREVHPKDPENIKPPVIGNEQLVTTRFKDEDLIRTSQLARHLIDEKKLDPESRSLLKTANGLLDDADWMAKVLPIYQKFNPGKAIETPQDAIEADVLYTQSAKGQTKIGLPAKTRINVNAGGKDGELGINDVWKYIEDEGVKMLEKTAATKTNQVILMNNLPTDAINVVVKEINKGYPASPLNADELFIVPRENGMYEVYQTDDNGQKVIDKKYRKAVLTKKGVNFGVQAAAPEKREVAKEEKVNKKSKFPLPKGQAKTVKQGTYTYTWNENTGQYE